MTYDKICLMLPTYGRSATYLPEFISSAMATGDSERVCFAFCVNERDEQTRKFLSEYFFGKFRHEVITENLSRPNLSEYFNMLYEKTGKSAGTVVSMVGDDMVFETPGWDKAILGLINHYKGIGVFYCNDAYLARERLCVNLFVTREMVKLTGRAFMAAFEAEMIDVVWYEVGRVTKTLHFLADVVIRHNHNTRKPLELRDSTAKRLRIVQKAVHDNGGKARAKRIGAEIGAILTRVGVRGDSIC